MPYSSCCRTQNEPMETTRIAHDLSNNGFDRVIQLAIAQESLRQLQESLKDLPEIETEYMEAIRGLQQSDSSILKERMRKLAEEMMELRREMESAPGGIEKLKNDIALLKKVNADAKGNGHAEGSYAPKTKVGGQEDILDSEHGHGEGTSTDGDLVTKKVGDMSLLK